MGLFVLFLSFSSNYGKHALAPAIERPAWDCRYETYKCVVVDLASKEPLKGEAGIAEMDGSVEWGIDNKEVYYLKQDAAHRPFELWRHRLVRASTRTPPSLHT